MDGRFGRCVGCGEVHAFCGSCAAVGACCLACSAERRREGNRRRNGAWSKTEKGRASNKRRQARFRADRRRVTDATLPEASPSSTSPSPSSSAEEPTREKASVEDGRIDRAKRRRQAARRYGVVRCARCGRVLSGRVRPSEWRRTRRASVRAPRMPEIELTADGCRADVMMRRPVTAEETARILRLHHAEEWPVGTIGAQLGRHHDTVERVLAQSGSRRCTSSRRGHGWSTRTCRFSKETLEKYPRLRASRLWSMAKAAWLHGLEERLPRDRQPTTPAPARRRRTCAAPCSPGRRGRSTGRTSASITRRTRAARPVGLRDGAVVQPAALPALLDCARRCRASCAGTSSRSASSERCRASSSTTTSRAPCSSARATPSAFIRRCSPSPGTTASSRARARRTAPTRRAASSGRSRTSATTSSPRANSARSRTSTRRRTPGACEIAQERRVPDQRDKTVAEAFVEDQAAS